ncbi:MAG: sulfotransferase [Synechococcaceae cyanobacterium RL_1_2]|nr:sulfotransferase [Synechococcaceae cyanobacterium RL_1_2]
MLPNFLLIGAQKAGTTSLYSYLKQHPQVYMSPIKEPGFFDFEGQPPTFQGPGDRELYEHVVTDIDRYHGLFDGVEGQHRAVGEATTWYLSSPRAPQAIKHHLPGVKLIAILRNPVDRAYSAFMHTIRDSREQLRDFDQALALETQRTQDNWEYLWRYTAMGMYSEQIQRYYEQFDRAQLKIYLYDDLKNDANGLMKDMFQYLGIDDDFTPSTGSRHNMSGVPKNQWVQKFLNQRHPIKEPLKLLFPKALRESISTKFKQLNYRKSSLSQDSRRQLQQVFKEDIVKLQDLIDRDLSPWLS